MSTEINNQLFVLRHVETKKYVCFPNWNLYLDADARAAFLFDSLESSILTDVFDKDNWKKDHFPSILEFEVVELLMAPDTIIIRQ